MGLRIYEPQVQQIGGSEIVKHIRNSMILEENSGFRGQENSNWALTPTLARFYKSIIGQSPNADLGPQRHQILKIELFQSFQRELLASEQSDCINRDEVEIWQLGRHFGLPTPFLDWTRSPYVALFFATAPPIHKQEASERCIWTINLNALDIINRAIDGLRAHLLQKFDKTATDTIFSKIEYLPARPTNKRARAQQAFFTRHNHYGSVENWGKSISSELPHPLMGPPMLSKICFKLTEPERENTLRDLDLMGINYRTLFPDVCGSVLNACMQAERRCKTRRSFSYSATSAG